MTSPRQSFWEHGSFAVVGHSAQRNFPKITYKKLRDAGRTVYAVDPSVERIGGDVAYRDLASLRGPVEAAVLELPKDETADWVTRVADAGIGAVWIHQQTDTPEALEPARARGLEVCSGACAVMYVTPGLSPRAPHRWIMKLAAKF